MKRYVKTIGAGLLIGLLLVGVYELAGGDATIVVLLVLLAAHVKVRLDELRDTLDTMRAAEPGPICGDVMPNFLTDEELVCSLAQGHQTSWHTDSPRSQHPVKWRHRP